MEVNNILSQPRIGLSQTSYKAASVSSFGSLLASEIESKKEKPTIREFREATGVDFEMAGTILSGVVGSVDDTRDWSSIMGSSDPLRAAFHATEQMLNSQDRDKVKGYKPKEDEIIASSGNYTVVKNNSDPKGWSLYISDADGILRKELPIMADEILKSSAVYGVDISAMGELGKQLDAAGIKHRPYELFTGSNHGVDFVNLSNGGTGSAYDWTSDYNFDKKGKNAELNLQNSKDVASYYGIGSFNLGTVSSEGATILSSNAFELSTIQTIYSKYLDRSPDAEGLAYWSKKLQDGVSVEEIEKAFISSSEYIAKTQVPSSYPQISAQYPTQQQVSTSIQDAITAYDALKKL